MNGFHRLLQVVQRNCDIADARHARDLTMCNYLLAMRELYRWERDLPAVREPDRALLGRWLRDREGLWSALETASFCAVPVAAQEFDPFDTDAINSALASFGLAYGAGYGHFGRPHFFLGALERLEQRSGRPLRVVGCEYARDIAAIPASYQRGTICLRQDALERWIRDRLAQFGAAPRAGALARAIAQCGPHNGRHRNPSSRGMAAIGEYVIAHELGEAQAEDLLDSGWTKMLEGFRRPRAELLARAVRDNLADCLSTLPYLLQCESTCAMHFFFANFEGLRRSAFPRLAHAYAIWCETGDSDPLVATARDGCRHWKRVALELVRLCERDPDGREVERIFAGDLGDIRL